MIAYDAITFDPPVPVAYITLRNGDSGGEWSDVPMQLDSGADITLIPQAAVGRLNLTVATDVSYELEGFDGHTTTASMVRLELVFCRRTFRAQFLLIDQPWGILGRNVLNNVPLLFDGPNLVWDEYHHAK